MSHNFEQECYRPEDTERYRAAFMGEAQGMIACATAAKHGADGFDLGDFLDIKIKPWAESCDGAFTRAYPPTFWSNVGHAKSFELNAWAEADYEESFRIQFFFSFSRTMDSLGQAAKCTAGCCDWTPEDMRLYGEYLYECAKKPAWPDTFLPIGFDSWRKAQNRPASSCLH